MTTPAESAWLYAPFWVVIYVLGVVTWTCVGRFMLAWFVPAIQPNNYIWRGFVWITEWAVRGFGWITPRYVRPVFLPLVAAFWLYWVVRPLVFALFTALGLTPSIRGG